MQLTILNEQKHELSNISTMEIIMVLDTLSVPLLNLIQKENKLIFVKIAKVLLFVGQIIN
jgi:hypothetical protein